MLGLSRVKACDNKEICGVPGDIACLIVRSGLKMRIETG